MKKNGRRVAVGSQSRQSAVINTLLMRLLQFILGGYFLKKCSSDYSQLLSIMFVLRFKEIFQDV
jgi:hypothetical protein